MQRFFRFPLLALLATLAHAAGPDAVVHVSLTAPGYTSANAPEMPRVKFNKAAPLCMISDDMSLSDFCSTWALFNGYPHPETTKDRQYPRGDVFLDQAVRDLPAGYYDGDADGDGAPDGVHEPLTFSDGAGLRRRFACSSAVFLQSDGNYLQISPADVRTMSRTGWSATYHDVDQCDVGDAASIAARFAPLSARWEALTGHAPKIMTEPNGNHTYLDACRMSPEICWSLFQNAAAGYPANSMKIADWTDRATGIPSSFESKPQGSFYRIWAQGYEYNFSNAVNRVIDSGAGTEIIVGGTHGVQSWFKTYFLKEIQESDRFWVASVDEIWEYYWLWHHVSFENLAYDPATQRLSFDVRIPAPAKHQFRDITVNLPGLAGASDWSVEGAVTANAAQGENGFTMNLGVEDHVLRDADELLDLREQHVDNPCIARDAQYLVSLLAPGPGKDARQARLDRQLKYSWSVRSQQNDLFTAGACNEPTNFAYAVPLFVLHGTDLYRLEPNDYGRSPLCGGTVALDDAHPAFATNWTYTVREAHGKGVEGCAFYAEGEDLFPAAPGLFDVAGLSLRAAGQPAGAGAVPLGRLSPGVYKFGFQYYRPSGAGKSTWTVLTNGAPAVVHANNKNDARSDVMTAEFTLARGADVALAVTPNSGASGDLVDAVWFKKTGEVAVIAPELGAVEADTSARGAVTLRVPVVSLGPEAESAALVFAPTNASPAGADLVVEGVATPVAGARPAPEGEPLAGLSFAEEGLLVWADGAWRKASGASWRSGETSWRAELDFAADAPARVRYAVGGAVATVDGEEWLPVAAGATGAERVVLLGRGTLGDFRGVLRALVADPVEIPAPVFAEGGAALSFPDAATFSLTLSGTDAGFWYTAFASDSVEGPYVAEADSVRGTGGTLALTLDADAAEHPARFVRVAVSREPCAAGVSLESFLAQ